MALWYICFLIPEEHSMTESITRDKPFTLIQMPCRSVSDEQYRKPRLSGREAIFLEVNPVSQVLPWPEVPESMLPYLSSTERHHHLEDTWTTPNVTPGTSGVFVAHRGHRSLISILIVPKTSNNACGMSAQFCLIDVTVTLLSLPQFNSLCSTSIISLFLMCIFVCCEVRGKLHIFLFIKIKHGLKRICISYTQDPMALNFPYTFPSLKIVDCFSLHDSL